MIFYGEKVKATFEKKLIAVKEYLEGKKSQIQLAREYNVSKTTINQWVSVYKEIGEEGLYTTSKNNSFQKRDLSRILCFQFINKNLKFCF